VSSFFNHQKLASCFCATTRLYLFNTEFLVFLCICYAHDLVSNKCWVVRFCYVVTGWFYKNFAWATNIVRTHLSLAKIMFVDMFFMYNSFGS
jgi:hypothetical protein